MFTRRGSAIFGRDGGINPLLARYIWESRLAASLHRSTGTPERKHEIMDVMAGSVVGQLLGNTLHFDEANLSLLALGLLCLQGPSAVG